MSAIAVFAAGFHDIFAVVAGVGNASVGVDVDFTAGFGYLPIGCEFDAMVFLNVDGIVCNCIGCSFDIAVCSIRVHWLLCETIYFCNCVLYLVSSLIVVVYCLLFILFQLMYL